MSHLRNTPLDGLLSAQPCVADFIASLGLTPGSGCSVGEWLDHLSDEDVFDAGMERQQMLDHIGRLIDEVAEMAATAHEVAGSVTILGGRDKRGVAETTSLTVRRGEVVCVVGPTGSGKSRLLGDIECLAQGDTPSGRRVLVDDRTPDDLRRYAPDRKLVAQLSQNMNFVVDLKVADFVRMHAHCRMVADPESMAEQVIACANGLTGEKFSADASVTQLSGGQTRALMIADVALLSASPIVLIDEIENAGVDRKRALELLVTGEKIVFISTHDPLLALRGHRRVVIRDGGMAEVLETNEAERRNLEHIEAVDAVMLGIRERLRRGERIEGDIQWPR